ncbi:MAG TPA: lasso peptide biosynthesis B2 protein [Gemmatimonadaceae bacterium]|nr:lasso peptide biosynthesis B2 protein [Gemmatimonadaceae bacterium]
MNRLRSYRRRFARGLHNLRRLAGLPPAEVRRLVRAQVALIRARVMLSVRKTGELVQPEPVAPTYSRADLVRAREWALMVRRASVYGIFQPSCLTQSIALSQLLERDGIEGARIRVGVRHVAGAVQAHAWVEYGGEVIGDFGEHVATFTQLTDVRLIRPEDS